MLNHELIRNKLKSINFGNLLKRRKVGLTGTENQVEKEGDLGSVQHVAPGQRQEKEIDLELRQEGS